MNNYRQFYKEAEPIWLKGLSKELNVCMDTVFEGTYKNLFLLIAGSTYYQVFVNKKLIHYGPERRAKNCFSIDRVSVPDLCDDDKITIRCIGYNCRSFSNVNQNSFLIAELISEDKVVAATGKKEFKYYNNIMHEKDVVRYSSQRNFSEVWDYRKIMKEYEIERTSVDGEFAMRKTPYSEYTEFQAERAEVLRYKTVDELSGPIFEYLINPPKNFDHFNYDKIKENIYILLPKKYRRRLKRLFKDINKDLFSFIKGTLILTIIVFVISLILFSCFKLKAPIFFALFNSVMNIIPYIGPIIGGVPIVIIAFTQSNEVGIFILVSVLIIQTLDNFIFQPIVMGKTMSLHPVTILIGLLIFEYFFGIIGMCITVPLLAVMKRIVLYLDKRYKIFNFDKLKTNESKK